MSCGSAAGDEVQMVTRALWGFDRGVDGGRWGQERGGQVMAGGGEPWVGLSADDDGFQGRLRC